MTPNASRARIVLKLAAFLNTYLIRCTSCLRVGTVLYSSESYQVNTVAEEQQVRVCVWGQCVCAPVCVHVCMYGLRVWPHRVR